MESGADATPDIDALSLSVSASSASEQWQTQPQQGVQKPPTKPPTASNKAYKPVQNKAYDFCRSVSLKYKQPPRGVPPPPLAMRGNLVVNKDSQQPVAIRGINWFGFNVGMSMVDGLWAGGHAAATDFGLIVYQLKLLGFNAVRLPFRWSDLDARPQRGVEKDCSPITVSWLTRRLLPEHLRDRLSRALLPGNVAPLANSRVGMCNTYVPSADGYERLAWVTQVFVSQGMYVVLDYQPMGTELQAYDVSLFVRSWEKLWRLLACTPNFRQDLAGRVFVDAINEPDSMRIAWEPEGGRPGARQLYLALADRLWSLTPRAVLFFFEGTGQNKIGLNWGNGFITDPQVISRQGISDARPFFRALVDKPYNTSVVLTPHVYPPSITLSTFLGEALWKQCRLAFGYLQEAGFCTRPGDASSCRQFPVLVGEVGSAYEDASDKQWLEDFADYANAQGGARRFTSVPVNGWMWWAYNENSGDTGGIVRNNWQDLHWEKLDYLISRLGLRPWYTRLDGYRIQES